jgi:hypothetical protein
VRSLSSACPLLALITTFFPLFSPAYLAHGHDNRTCLDVLANESELERLWKAEESEPWRRAVLVEDILKDADDAPPQGQISACGMLVNDGYLTNVGGSFGTF